MMTIAPAPDDLPQRPKGPQKPKPPRTFEEVLKELRPDIEKLPAEKIPPQPPDPMVLESVEEFVASHGMTVPDSCPSTIAVAGEFLDRSGLREGRVDLHGNVRVLSFLYRFSDKLLRAVVLYPRDGVDARFLGMAICWGLVANVPPSIAQSRILEVKDFFAINAFDMTKIVDVTALERFKADHSKQVAGDWQTFKRQTEGRTTDLERERAGLAATCQKLGEELNTQRRRAVAQHNRAEAWKVAALSAVCLIPIALIILRFFGV